MGLALLTAFEVMMAPLSLAMLNGRAEFFARDVDREAED